MMFPFSSTSSSLESSSESSPAGPSRVVGVVTIPVNFETETTQDLIRVSWRIIFDITLVDVPYVILSRQY